MKRERQKKTMTESNFEHEYFFLLGAGASAASACPIMKKLFGVPIWGSFVDLLRRIRGIGEIELSRIIDDCHLDHPYYQYIQRVIEISEEKGTTDISVLLKNLYEEKSQLFDESGKNLSGYFRVSTDIDKLIEVIIGTIAAYYSHFDSEYYSRLWQIVKETKSPVVSLNWDINFEIVVSKDTRVPMSNYYSEHIFRNLLSNEQEKGFNSIVEILKPHGSLNWHFRTNELNRERQKERTGGNDPIAAYGGNFEEDEYYLHVYDHVLNAPFAINELNQYAFWVPPLPEKEIALLDSGEARDYFDNYWIRKKKIKDSVFKKIEAHAKTSRTLVIIGYSFPSGDEHIRNLFIGNQFENVWVFDTSEETIARIDKEKCFQKTKRKFFRGGFAEILNLEVGEGFKPFRG